MWNVAVDALCCCSCCCCCCCCEPAAIDRLSERLGDCSHLWVGSTGIRYLGCWLLSVCALCFATLHCCWIWGQPASHCQAVDSALYCTLYNSQSHHEHTAAERAACVLFVISSVVGVEQTAESTHWCMINTEEMPWRVPYGAIALAHRSPMRTIA